MDEHIRDIFVRLALDPAFRAALDHDATAALAPYGLDPADEAALRAGDHRMLDLLARAQRASGITARAAPEPTSERPLPAADPAPRPPPPDVPELRFLVRCAPYPFWDGQSWRTTWGVSIHPAPDVAVPSSAPPPSPAPDRRKELRDAVLAAAPDARWDAIVALAAEIGRV